MAVSSTRTWTYTMSTHLFINASIEKVEQPAVVPNFFCRNWKIFVMYWWFCSRGCCPHKSPCACRVWRFLLIKLFSKNLNFELFPVASLENFRFLGFGWCAWSPCPSSSFTGLTRCPKSCGGFPFVFHGLRDTKLTDFAFAGTVGLGIGEPSLEVASWPLFLTCIDGSCISCFGTLALESHPGQVALSCWS